MWFLKVFAVLYLADICTAQDVTVTQTANTDSVTRAPPITVYVPPIPAVQLKTATWDVFLSEKVVLSCIIEGASDWTFTWQRDGQEQSSGPSFSFPGDGSVLTVTAENENQSGGYSCKGHHKTRGVSTKTSDNINIKVNDLPTPILTSLTAWPEAFENEALSFKCEVSKSDWLVTWYRNNDKLDENKPLLNIPSVSQADGGRYTCRAILTSRGVKSHLSNPSNVIVHEKKPKPQLTQNLNFNKMYPGESVTFTCLVTVSSGWEYEWYRSRSKIQESSNTITIRSLDHSDSGEYHCKAKRGQSPFYTEESDTITLQVSDPPTPTLKQLSPWLDVFVNEAVGFSCEVSSPDWTFTWYRNGKKLNDEGSLLKISSVSRSDQGKYTCKAHLKSRGVNSDFSQSTTLNVNGEKPKPQLSQDPSLNKMYPGESVTFTCLVTVSSGWEYEWYRSRSKIQESSNTITIRILDHSDSGEYHCKAKRGQSPFYTEASDTITLQVSDPPTPTLKQLSPWLDVFENEAVGFSCEVSSPDWTFTWYRNGIKLNDEGSLLKISSVSQSDQGKYTCKAHLKSRGVNSDFSNPENVKVYENVPTPKLSKAPGFDPMYIGEQVTFTCRVDVSSGWNYQWYKDGTKLSQSGDALKITLDLSEGGQYSCTASRGEKTSTGQSEKIEQVVLEIPVPSVKPVTQRLDVFPAESVKLNCGMQRSSGWTYTWFKNEREVWPNDTVTIDADGINLSIGSASSSHHGSYSCSGKLKDRSVNSKGSSKITLDVYDTPPRVTVIQNPEYSLMHTSDSVSFTCQVSNSSGWEYEWYKDDKKLETSGNNHSITSVMTKDTGSYKCRVKRGVHNVFHSTRSQGVSITVEERPQASIILLTGWSEVFSTDSLVLKCEVTDQLDNWNYTWFRERKRIDLVPSEKYVVTPQNDPTQSQYTCMGIRSGRPSFSKSSHSFKTKNLLLKRRILLSISGCLFFGIILVLVGCIFLKVFHKPAAADEKPEEANLFLTMAQLKDCTDTPSPLVEYITDADLNAPPKEDEGNGTICSETTALPITSQEDQVVTTDGCDVAENGGGMLSFQQ